MEKEHSEELDEDALEQTMEKLELREAKAPLTLLTIDEDALKKIMEKVDFKSIMTLRKVCHPLRNFLKKENSNINLVRLTVQTDSPKSIQVNVTSRRAYQSIVYTKNGDSSCAVLLDEVNGRGHVNSKNINMGYCEAFLNDIKIILAHQKSTLQFFSVQLEEASTANQILNGLLEIFETRSSKLKVEHISFSHKDRLISIIPFIEPVTLRIIGIENFVEELDFSPLLELDQFKHAKRIDSETVLTSTPLNRFMYLRSVDIKKRTITLEDVRFLKEMFFSNHTIQRFAICVENLNDTKQAIYNFLGPATNSRSWNFEIPESDMRLVVVIREKGRKGLVVFQKD